MVITCLCSYRVHHKVVGGAIVMYSSTTITADNDKQIAAENGCHNGAAPIGAPAAGTFTKAGYTNGDWNYAWHTVMATVYGLM